MSSVNNSVVQNASSHNDSSGFDGPVTTPAILARTERTSAMSFKPPGIKPKQIIQPVVTQEPDPPSKLSSALGSIIHGVKWIPSLFTASREPVHVDESVNYEQGNLKKPTLPKDLVPPPKVKSQLVVSERTDKLDKKANAEKDKQAIELIGDFKPTFPEGKPIAENTSGSKISKKVENKVTKQNESKPKDDRKKPKSKSNDVKPNREGSHQNIKSLSATFKRPQQTTKAKAYSAGIEFETSGSAFKIKSPAFESTKDSSKRRSKSRSNNKINGKDKGNVWKRSKDAPRPIAARIVSAPPQPKEKENSIIDSLDISGALEQVNFQDKGPTDSVPLTLSGLSNRSKNKALQFPDRSNSASSTYSRWKDNLKDKVVITPPKQNEKTLPGGKVGPEIQLQNNEQIEQSTNKPSKVPEKSLPYKPANRSASRTERKSKSRPSRSRSRSLTKAGYSDDISNKIQKPTKTPSDTTSKTKNKEESKPAPTFITVNLAEEAPKPAVPKDKPVIADAASKLKPVVGTTEEVRPLKTTPPPPPPVNKEVKTEAVVTSTLDSVISAGLTTIENSLPASTETPAALPTIADIERLEAVLPIRRKGADIRRSGRNSRNVQGNILGGYSITPKSTSNTPRAKALTRPSILTRKPLANKI